MQHKSYTRQLELHIEELQEQLAIQQKTVEDLQNNTRFVVICDGNVSREAALNITADLVVVPMLDVVYVVPLSSPTPYSSSRLYKSVKDRCNPCGSIYDIDMLRNYAHGRTVVPYTSKK
jgi:hypothetical protein